MLPPDPYKLDDAVVTKGRVQIAEGTKGGTTRQWGDNSLVCMADNGPMSHNPPPGIGRAETIYRGGKGDFLESGVGVPAMAYWPGVVAPGQIFGDILHETG